MRASVLWSPPGPCWVRPGPADIILLPACSPDWDGDQGDTRGCRLHVSHGVFQHPSTLDCWSGVGVPGHAQVILQTPAGVCAVRMTTTGLPRSGLQSP